MPGPEECFESKQALNARFRESNRNISPIEKDYHTNLKECKNDILFIAYDFSADPVKAQLIINSLREKIAPFKEFLLMIVESPVRMEGDQDSLRLVLHFIFFSFNSGLG